MLAAGYSLFQPWADLYGSSVAISAGVTAAHLAGMLIGGGFAIAADRSTLRALRHPKALAHHLGELEAVHRPVLAGLTVTVATGFLMLAADLEVLIGSPLFWAKMVALVALLANGARLRSSARHLALQSDPGRWRAQLAGAARTSGALWLVALVLGAILPTA